MKITDDIIRKYTEGDCWILALALNELTGWPLMLWGEWETRKRYEGGLYNWETVFMWCHAAVSNRPGFIVDVYGELPDNDSMFEYYGRGHWEEFSKEKYMLEMVEHPPITKHQYSHAKRVSKQLLSNMKVSQDV